MNRQFLIMVATVCGLLMVVSLMIFPTSTWGEGKFADSARAIQLPNGGFLLLATWVAAGFAGLVFLKKINLLGMTDGTGTAISFLGFKLTAFFCIAMLIAGPMRDGGWGLGFWLTFIASLVGAFAVYLTFNPDLAAKIAAAAKEKPEEAAAEKKEE